MASKRSSLSESRMTGKTQKLDPTEIQFASKTDQSLFWNARQNLDPEQMEELRESIQTDGLLEDPVVRRLPDGSYQVVCGERRLRCILYLLQHEDKCWSLLEGILLPAVDVYGTMHMKVLCNCSDMHASRLSVAENLKRKDLSEWELMEYCRQLLDCMLPDDSEAYSRKDVCYIISRSATWVSQTMHLYELPGQARKMLSDGTLPRTVALKLLSVNEDCVDKVLKLTEQLAQEDLSRDVQRANGRVRELQDKLAGADISVSAVELTGGNLSPTRQTRSRVDKELSDACSRQKTAKNRQPRLSADTITRATDQVGGARKGKSNGMSHKSVRQTVLTLKERLASGETQCPVTGHDLDKRDLAIMMLSFQMVLGQITERNPSMVLSEYYTTEGRKGWSPADIGGKS